MTNDDRAMTGGAATDGTTRRAIRVTGGTVHAATAGDLRSTERRDLLVVGDRIVRPSEPVAEGERIDADGASVVPLLVQSAIEQRAAAGERTAGLSVGDPATFAVIRRTVTDREIHHALVVSPHDLVAVLVDGYVEAAEGKPVRAAGADVARRDVALTWVGTWSDPSRGLDQHLLPTGRYSETRGGRRDAYTGRYWVRGDRITYLDDAGFWAFGEQLDGVLHHAGFVMTRRAGIGDGPTPTGR